MSRATRILGIDPGLQTTGWGIIEKEGSSLRYVGAGIIRPEKDLPLYQRLTELHEGIQNVLKQWTPDEAAIEETFVTANGASTLKLGQARGAILLSLSMAGFPVYEYAATQVKKTVTGKGRAEKQQVTRMVHYLLPGCDVTQPDAADALAIAICHGSHANLLLA